MLIRNLCTISLSDCSVKNATDSSWIMTTESSDSTTSSPTIDSTHTFDLDGDDGYSTEPFEYLDNSTDSIEYDTTATPSTTSSSSPSSSQSPRSARRKRHINFPGGGNSGDNAYTMEVMVAVDRKMQEYHGNNIQAYVLTLMSIVSNIYADPSIGNSINVAVVHIMLLRDDLHVESNQNGKH